MPQLQRIDSVKNQFFILGLMAVLPPQPLLPMIELKYFFSVQTPVNQGILGFMYVLGSLPGRIF